MALETNDLTLIVSIATVIYLTLWAFKQHLEYGTAYDREDRTRVNGKWHWTEDLL